MLNTLILLAIFVFSALINPEPAHAYLDPGSGSYFIQIVIATLAGSGFLIKTQWGKIKEIFKKPKEKKGGEDKKSD